MSQSNPIVQLPHRKSRASLFALALALLFATSAQATTVSPNTGSLGASAHGVNADAVTFGPGVVTGGGDQAAFYNEATGTTTVVNHQAALNPPNSSPFTIEFWAKPTETDNDDAPVSNRNATDANRSGWVFFQRAAGWNFRTYNGSGSAVGWDLTGGTSNLNEWSHVVATWDGTGAGTARLFVNGVLADDTNSGPGGYNASSTANLILAASDTGSPYLGWVDEVAFYDKVLSDAQILAHFNAAASPTAGLYHNLIRSDGALLQLSNNAVPEPSTVALLSAGALLLFRRRTAKTSPQISI